VPDIVIPPDVVLPPPCPPSLTILEETVIDPEFINTIDPEDIKKRSGLKAFPTVPEPPPINPAPPVPIVTVFPEKRGIVDGSPMLSVPPF
jgi:hypothetical protein